MIQGKTENERIYALTRVTFWHVTHATGIGSSQRIEIKEEKRKGATVTNI